MRGTLPSAQLRLPARATSSVTHPRRSHLAMPVICTRSPPSANGFMTLVRISTTHALTRCARPTRPFSSKPDAALPPRPEGMIYRESQRAREGIKQVPIEWQELVRQSGRAEDAQRGVQQLIAAQRSLGPAPASVYKELGYRISKLPGSFAGMSELHKMLIDSKLKAYGECEARHLTERRFKDAMKIFDEARKYATFDAMAYDMAMHILAKEGEAAQVFSLFNELKNLGVQPTERHYGPVLSMCVNDREKFNALRAEARSLGFRLVPYWDTLVNVLLRQNDVPAALDTYRSLRPDAKRFDVLLINRLFQSLRRMGNISAIIEVYHLERDLGVFLPPSLMIHVIWAYAQQVDYHKAMSVFDTARNELKERTAAMPALQERYYKAELAMVRQALDITARQRDVELSLRYYLQDGFHPRQLPQDFLKLLLGFSPTDGEIDYVLTRLIEACDAVDKVGFASAQKEHTSTVDGENENDMDKAMEENLMNAPAQL